MKQTDWVGVNEAAALVGKSLSTIRRLIPALETAGHIHRDGITGKVLFSRSHLVERFGLPEQAITPPDTVGLIEVLQRQLEAKDRQIMALQRDSETKSRQIEEAQAQAAQIIQNLLQAQILNAALQTKIFTIGKGQAASALGEPSDFFSSRWYYVAIYALATLVVALFLWVFLRWIVIG
ncbi:MAG: helix-turn-helix domain-containing protein [Saprospiraceae bacterium]|nr:helix-turn-helix domain-containing protein [Saprospiraceae bacterium]